MLQTSLTTYADNLTCPMSMDDAINLTVCTDLIEEGIKYSESSTSQNTNYIVICVHYKPAKYLET